MGDVYIRAVVILLGKPKSEDPVLIRGADDKMKEFYVTYSSHEESGIISVANENRYFLFHFVLFKFNLLK